MRHRFTPLAAVAALLTTSATQPPDLHVAPPPPERNSPVRCRVAPPEPVYRPQPAYTPTRTETAKERRAREKDARRQFKQEKIALTERRHSKVY